VVLFCKRRDHLIVIEHMRSSPQEAAGIAADVTASTAVAPAAGTPAVADTPAADRLAAGTPVPGTAVVDIELQDYMAAAHMSIAVAVWAGRRRMVERALQERPDTQRAARISHWSSRQLLWQLTHHRYQHGYPIQSIKGNVSGRVTSATGGNLRIPRVTCTERRLS
jgi:hypothetical protein